MRKKRGLKREVRPLKVPKPFPRKNDAARKRKPEADRGIGTSEQKKNKKIVATANLQSNSKERLIDNYEFSSNKMPISISIVQKPEDFVPTYNVSISSISKTTELVLEKIRQELINEVNLGIIEIISSKKGEEIEEKFVDAIEILVHKHFPDVDDRTSEFLISYLIQKSLGMGNIEILMDDDKLEEVAVNNSESPVWVYHKKWAWLKTNIFIENEDLIKHYASMIGRRIGRQISLLDPLLDAHLPEGDRVNATLMPISTTGNTITLRKYSRDPFTITNFLKYKTITPSAAAMIWMAIQYELSGIIAGGTASGKTATLNVLASFIPPNQRIISIEDTRELRLPNFLHWVPMSTRLPNPEGRGGILMEDLLVNSLRMRPDRILVGEVRRAREAETLFEAIHTGHSCYATFHANNSKEVVKRFCNPPLNIPETVMPSISMIITQFRNRRTGIRRTFEISEIDDNAKVNVLKRYDMKKDSLVDANHSRVLLESLRTYTGFSPKEIRISMKRKEDVLKYLVRQDITHVDKVGKVIAEYYKDKDNLMRFVYKNKQFI